MVYYFVFSYWSDQSRINFKILKFFPIKSSNFRNSNFDLTSRRSIQKKLVVTIFSWYYISQQICISMYSLFGNILLNFLKLCFQKVNSFLPILPTKILFFIFHKRFVFLYDSRWVQWQLAYYAWLICLDMNLCLMRNICRKNVLFIV